MSDECLITLETAVFVLHSLSGRYAEVHISWEISRMTQIYFQSPAALGIPKGDACYRRDARNEGNKRNVFVRSHRSHRSHRFFLSPAERKETFRCLMAEG